jgi:hypothetical protein
VLTSREKPAEIAVLEGGETAVRLANSMVPRRQRSPSSSQAINRNNTTETIVGRSLWQQSVGTENVSTSIQELFDSNIDNFLQEDTLILTYSTLTGSAVQSLVCFRAKHHVLACH